MKQAILDIAQQVQDISADMRKLNIDADPLETAAALQKVANDLQAIASFPLFAQIEKRGFNTDPNRTSAKQGTVYHPSDSPNPAGVNAGLTDAEARAVREAERVDAAHEHAGAQVPAKILR